MSKGQGTIEYLIILSVVIVIALVVVGVMGWFPGLGTGITEQQSKAYWKITSPLAISDWKITSDGATFTVQNLTTDKIGLTDISVDGAALGLADVNVAAGAIVTTIEDADATCTSGEDYQYDIKISYDVSGGISGKTLTGLKPIVGTCP